MKKLSVAVILMFAVAKITYAQNAGAKSLPAADVKTMDGKSINTNTFSNNGKPIVISFWATWCKPCKKELDAIAEHYEDWVEQTGVKLIAISTDDSRSSSKVAADVKSKDWKYDIYIDENQDFKRAMSVNMIPHVFVIDGKGNVVWQHNSYADGDEDELFEIVKKVSKGEKLN